jgi:hypothetical protein
MSEAAPTDDAVTINSSVMLGPIALGAPGNEGVLTEIAAILDASSGDVAWAIHTGDSPEAAVASTTPAATGVWSAGANHSQYPRARGVAATIRLSATGPWAIESIDITRLAGGKAR